MLPANLSVGTQSRRWCADISRRGNGTASREVSALVQDFLRDNKLASIFSVVVSEAGASVYSASEVARQEFPDLDLTIRGAISIARRLQDPLSELVKIDPKSIGVGQYQHDVDQRKLTTALEATVESCVNRVGVDLNTASFTLLRHVAGINERMAIKIVEFRNEKGRFKSRFELRAVPGFGPKTFEQAAGFLRIRDGDNPLDMTAVHPESYPIVQQIAESLNVTVAHLIANPALADAIQIDKLAAQRSQRAGLQAGSGERNTSALSSASLTPSPSFEAGLYTLKDIQEELRKPGRDPRQQFVAPQFLSSIKEIADLTPGMTLEGVITNVTAFGAFVDVGVHQDGLVHVSELSNSFVKDPPRSSKSARLSKSKFWPLTPKPNASLSL